MMQAQQTPVAQGFGRVVRTAGPGPPPQTAICPGAYPTRSHGVGPEGEFGFRTAAPTQRTRDEPKELEQESPMLTGDLNIVDVDGSCSAADGRDSEFGRSPERSRPMAKTRTELPCSFRPPTRILPIREDATPRLPLRFGGDSWR
jgi:hypothetical protein